MDINTLYKLATKFQKQAQTVSAQPGDVEQALENSKLWNLSTTVSPMLNQAGVPDDASVTIYILVGKGAVVGFNSVLLPVNPKVSAKLNGLLKLMLLIP